MSEKNPPQSNVEKKYVLRVDQNLHEKIDSHIRELKYLQLQKPSKQKWIEEAIIEKLKEEQNLSPGKLAKEKHISFSISRRLSHALEKQVDLIRKFRTSYSQKQWILDAISKKMEREEPNIRKLLKKTNSTHSAKEEDQPFHFSEEFVN